MERRIHLVGAVTPTELDERQAPVLLLIADGAKSEGSDRLIIMVMDVLELVGVWVSILVKSVFLCHGVIHVHKPRELSVSLLLLDFAFFFVFWRDEIIGFRWVFGSEYLL